MAHKSDEEQIPHTRNTARFFVENRQISWVLLVSVLGWGIYGYQAMPKKKDPDIPVRVAVATCPWPGVDAIQVEQLVTRPMERKAAESDALHIPGTGNEFGVKSLSLPGLAIVHIQLGEQVSDWKKEFNDIGRKLADLNPRLPAGAGPITLSTGFGQTSALMLTVASPRESAVLLELRAGELARAIELAREGTGSAGVRVSWVVGLPRNVDPAIPARLLHLFADGLEREGLGEDARPIRGGGFVGLDFRSGAADAILLDFFQRSARERLGFSGLHPDAWTPTLVRDPGQALAALREVAGARYSYAQLDDFTRLIENELQNTAAVSKIQRSGVLPRRIYLEYSQEDLAAYGIRPAAIQQILGARNVIIGGGTFQTGDSNIVVEPSGAFESPAEIGDVAISESPSGTPVYLRDLVETIPGYQSPPRFLNDYSWRNQAGEWQRGRAVTLAVMMRDGGEVAVFGEQVDAALEAIRGRLPADLIVARTSDQPRQVRESLDLFTDALMEAIALVVLAAWIGFWEWRSALLMACSIPITLAMTFGMLDLLGVSLQQVSVAALIIALGLLVDDPVVAGDAIKRDLSRGQRRDVAAWLGPTKLARAILFATLTNIVAYLPFLLMPGNSGSFIHSLPLVLACALVASRIVSMTFVPLIGYYVLRAPKRPEPSIEDKRHQGITGLYYRVGCHALDHPYSWLLSSLVILVAGLAMLRDLPTAFFPEDVQYFSYLDVWLPTQAPLAATQRAARQAEQIVREVARDFAEEEAQGGPPRRMLRSVTSFVGGGGPRFWFSVSPEIQQRNYAQLILEVHRKTDTPKLSNRLQRALSAGVPGAVIEFHQLETNPVGHPIEIHVSSRNTLDAGGEASEIRELRRIAQQVASILREVPESGVVRDDWWNESFRLTLRVDPDRANLAGLTNLDVATSSAAGMNGLQVTTYLEGDQQIPVVARLRPEQRGSLSDLESLYVFASEDDHKVPLIQIADLELAMSTQRIARREHFRTITVMAIPANGQLASVVLGAAQEKLDALSASLPPGYSIRYGGERAKQLKGFRNLGRVLVISMVAIFLCLVVQFNHAAKPLLVFSAVPYGAVGAVAALVVTGEAFGFMAFMGIVALVGVIISHVIVLFDFIEANREKGESLRDSLLDAGIARLRPVMITVGATALALVPLAIHGGPLWQPLCYAQIGGLSVAIFIELLLVKVFYLIFVRDLKLIGWDPPAQREAAAASGS